MTTGRHPPRELDRIAAQLTATYRGDAAGQAWHGPALRPLLRELSPAAAARRPLGGRHTTWEIVLHLAADVDFVLARLDGKALELAPEVDWPPMPEPSSEAWQAACALLDQRYDVLLARIRAMADEDLGAPVVGRSYSRYEMLHGIIQHGVYHCGQVTLLREAARAS